MITQVRKASSCDVPAMVEIHQRAFPGFFLTLLGRRFLRRMYAGFVHDAHGRAIVAEHGTSVVGYIVGTCCPEKYFRARLRSDGIALACAAVPALLRSPVRTAERLWAALRYRGERPPDLTDGWLVSSIAVDLQARAAGVGSALVRAFCEHAAQAQARYVYLLTDEIRNGRAHAFYERAGFKVHSTVTRGGDRVMRIYVQEPLKPEVGRAN